MPWYIEFRYTSTPSLAERGVSPVSTALPVTDKQLRDAIEVADVPPRDHRVFTALVHRVNWKTGVIPDRFADRSVEALAARCRMSAASTTHALAHLERHGWVKREPTPPGSDRPTRYIVAIGADCDCPKVPKQRARTDAQRARDYRERQKASRKISVTEARSSQQISVTRHGTECDDVPVQDGVSAEEGRDEGSRWEVMENWPDDTIGGEINTAGQQQ